MEEARTKSRSTAVLRPRIQYRKNEKKKTKRARLRFTFSWEELFDLFTSSMTEKAKRNRHERNPGARQCPLLGFNIGRTKKKKRNGHEWDWFLKSKLSWARSRLKEDFLNKIMKNSFFLVFAVETNWKQKSDISISFTRYFLTPSKLSLKKKSRFMNWEATSLLTNNNPGTADSSFFSSTSKSNRSL